MFTLNRLYSDTSPLTFKWLARLASALARFWLRLLRERHARLMIDELQALDDATLKDIGVYRCQIESMVRTGEWAKR